MVIVKQHKRRGRIVKSHKRFSKKIFDLHSVGYESPLSIYKGNGIHEENNFTSSGSKSTFKKRSHSNHKARNTFRNPKNKTLTGKSKISALKSLFK
jgi:hypothetical protein